ncbi:hypothetical protein GUJ93_ZPchr0002g24025 [Zizania palustris]|uniref:Uncharacterized protein n=1 Tax=Zizania palustris TaxID=103762 RepID=A0A8J5ST59_ZIZPA|nr:hypothetical protein GUJ93_ZPchr0002g24025 [Zizania palustris]
MKAFAKWPAARVLRAHIPCLPNPHSPPANLSPLAASSDLAARRLLPRHGHICRSLPSRIVRGMVLEALMVIVGVLLLRWLRRSTTKWDHTYAIAEALFGEKVSTLPREIFGFGSI